jgi:type II secretory pathway component PulK
VACNSNDKPVRHSAGALNPKDAAGPGKTALSGDERGIALLLVLWVIVFLAFVCAEFSWTMRTETATTSNFKEGIQAYYAAEAGINRAIIELQRASIESRRNSQALSTGDTSDSDTDAKQSDADIDDMYSDVYDSMPLWVAGGGPYRFEVGDFYCEVSIIDESNKLNINDFLKQAASNPTILKMFLTSEFGLEGDERDMIADSMIDWWDANDLTTGTFGAEDEYYMSLDPPYLCRNGNLPVMEDLLLVSGVTKQLFYGRGRHMEERIDLTVDELESLLAGEDTDSFFDDLMEGFIDDDDDFFTDNGSQSRLGLIDLFSVTSESTSFKININSATYEQLMLLEGMQPEDAQDIISERSERLFVNSGDRLPQYASYEVWKGLIRVEESSSLNNFTVYARGFSRDGRISRGIRCNLQVSADRCVISDWRLDS